MFLDDLKAYLVEQGYDNIFIDSMSLKADACISLFLYAHSTPTVNYGLSTRYLQIQVRRKDYRQAAQIAEGLCALLDSGANEEYFAIGDRLMLLRPTARPKKLTVDEHDRTVFYFEVSAIGAN